MIAAVDAERFSGAGALDTQSGARLIAVGTIDNISGRCGECVFVCEKEFRGECRNGLSAVLFVGIRIAANFCCRGLVAAFGRKISEASSGRCGWD